MSQNYVGDINQGRATRILVALQNLEVGGDSLFENGIAVNI